MYLELIEAALAADERPPLLGAEAGRMPVYYGTDDPLKVSALWVEMWRRMGRDDAFYQSNAIGWASR